MDTQIFISNHFYKQSDNRFLMAFLLWATACAVVTPFFFSFFLRQLWLFSSPSDAYKRLANVNMRIPTQGSRAILAIGIRIQGDVCVCVRFCSFILIIHHVIFAIGRLLLQLIWRLVNANGFSFCRCFNHYSNCYRWVIIIGCVIALLYEICKLCVGFNKVLDQENYNFINFNGYSPTMRRFFAVDVSKQRKKKSHVIPCMHLYYHVVVYALKDSA